MRTINFRYRLIWSFGLIAASLISFSALTPHGDTKSSPERFLKIAKWKLKVSWQASGNFADTLANEGGSLSIKISPHPRKLNSGSSWSIRPGKTEFV